MFTINTTSTNNTQQEQFNPQSQ